MATLIPRNIEDSEIIIRFAFEGDYRRKKPFIEENILSREVFFDKRFEHFPVSVLRKLYVSSHDCLTKGKAINPDLKSLILFQKKDFDQAVIKNSQVRSDFEAIIKGTPLDENNQYYPLELKVTTETPGNPAHADILITNPGIIEADDSNANTAVRSFSSILYKYCKIITLHEDLEVNEETFQKLFS